MTASDASRLPRADDPAPLPPADLASRVLPLPEMDNPTLFRGHKARRGAIHFNRDAGRWTDPDRHVATIYLGERPQSAFIEAFNQQMTHARWGLFINARDLHQFCLCPMGVSGNLRLVDVTEGRYLLAMGADHRICDGDHAVSRRWVQAFQSHPSRPDGIIYRSRYAPELRSAAIFETAPVTLAAACADNLLALPAALARMLDYFDCALL